MHWNKISPAPFSRSVQCQRKCLSAILWQYCGGKLSTGLREREVRAESSPKDVDLWDFFICVVVKKQFGLCGGLSSWWLILTCVTCGLLIHKTKCVVLLCFVLFVSSGYLYMLACDVTNKSGYILFQTVLCVTDCAAAVFSLNTQQVAVLYLVNPTPVFTRLSCK